jgi:hypothetical protein
VFENVKLIQSFCYFLKLNHHHGLELDHLISKPGMLLPSFLAEVKDDCRDVIY